MSPVYLSGRFARKMPLFFPVFVSSFKLLASVFFLSVFAAAGFGQTVASSQTPELKLGVPIEGSSATGEAQKFALHLESNQLAALVLQRKGFNAQIVISSAKDAQELVKAAINPGAFARDRVLFQNGGEPLDVLISVVSYKKESANGNKFSLTLAELKMPDARDKLRIDAQTALFEGMKFFAETEKDSREKASVSFETALRLARQSRDTLIEADTLAQMQSLFLAKNETEKSIEYGKAALALLDGQENNFNKLIIKNRIGVANINLGEIKAGIEILSENVEQLRQSGERTYQTIALNFLSNGLSRLGDYEKSLEYAEQAYRIAEESGDVVNQIQSLFSINRFYLNRGDFAKVIENANKALAISNETTLVYISGIYANLAGAYQGLGQIPKAIENFQQAVALNRQINGNKYNQAVYLANIADCYTILGQTSRAIDYNRQAVELFNQAGNKNALIAGLRASGSIHRALKEFEKAKQVYLEALKISESVGDKRSITILNASLGNVEYKLNHFEAAIEFYLKSVKLAGELKLQRPELTGLGYLSNAYLESGQMEKGGESAKKTLEKARAVGERIVESNALYNLARVRRSQKDLVGALRLIEDSLKIIESKRLELTNQESRTAYFSTVRDKYDFYISLLIELQNQPENKEFGALAFAASERARARGLLDLLAESYTDISAGINPGLKERERGIQAKLTALQTQLIQLKSAEKPNEKSIEELQKNIQQTDNERERLESEIRRTNPRYAELKYPTTVGLIETQKMLDDKTVLLEYQIGANNSYLFAVGKNEFQIVKLTDEKTLRASVEMLHRSLSTPARTGLANYTIAGRQLYQALVAPIENLLKTKTKIIVAADGALNYLPFETLLRNNQTASLDKLPYLVRDFEISYTPSVSILANLKSFENTAKPAKAFVAFAAPDYASEAANQNQSTAQNTRSVFGENRVWRLTDLQFARTEAEKIAKLFPAGQATVFTGADATETRVKQADFLNQFRYLHFAVHGLIDEEQPQFSSLVLSLPKENNQAVSQNAILDENPKSKIQNPKSAEDGLLQTPEIFNLRLQADLVTLSACETGLGQEMRGEGIVGLTRAFFYAGTPSVLVSLWKVDDASTAELMTIFYENLRKTGGRDKSAALRETQLKLIAANRYSHPYYWASFILQGKTSSNF